jgi:hypothetical protein
MMRQNFETQQLKIRIGDIEVQYYLREPTPDHWNAIGVITNDAELMPYGSSSTSRKMVVGVGPTEDEAVGDLIARVMSQFGQQTETMAERVKSSDLVGAC